jgi:hypothetical protein
MSKKRKRVLERRNTNQFQSKLAVICLCITSLVGEDEEVGEQNGFYIGRSVACECKGV